VERAYGLEIPESLEDAVDPRRLALVVYDMQVGILRQLRGADEVTANVLRVVEAARKAGVRVVFTRHMSLPNELAGVFQLRMAKAWQRVARSTDVTPWFLRDSAGFELIPQLSPLPSEAVLDKITMSAFEGTPLEIVLRDCGIMAFVIVGVATEIGIEPTVRHGADLGLIPIVVADACAGGNDEAARRSLAGIEFIGDAYVVDTDALCGLLGRSDPATG